MGDKNTSPAKVEANRNNAQKSTGPKTHEGKAVAKLNALTHGILSKELIIREGDGRENEEDFTLLLDGLVDNFKPVGSMEELLVEKIAICYWRLGRAIRYETGVLRAELDTHRQDFDPRVMWDGKSVNILQDCDKLQEKEREYIKGNENCIKLLKKLTDLSKKPAGADIDMEGYYWKLISDEYTSEDEDWHDMDLDIDRFLAEEMSLGEMRQFVLRKEWTDEQLRSNFIEQDLAGIAKAKRGIATLQNLKRKAELRMTRTGCERVLPRNSDVDKLIRYETAIERQLYKAINQLERLQRQRLGDSVSPPIHVDFTSTE